MNATLTGWMGLGGVYDDGGVGSTTRGKADDRERHVDGGTEEGLGKRRDSLRPHKVGYQTDRV